MSFLMLLLFTALFVQFFILLTQIGHVHGGNNSAKKGCYGFCEKFMELENELDKMNEIKENFKLLATEMDKSIHQFGKQMDKLRNTVTKLENENKKLQQKFERGKRRSIEKQNNEKEKEEEEDHFENIGLPFSTFEEGEHSAAAAARSSRSSGRHFEIEEEQQQMEEEEEKEEKEQLSHSKRLQRQPSLKPIVKEKKLNCWDQSECACHKELKISGQNKWKVTNKGTQKNKCRSVFAEQPIPMEGSHIFYFEVKILQKKGPIYIGFGKKEKNSVDGWVGFNTGTYAYGSSGSFSGHNVMGPEFKENDTVGCGINLRTNQIIYTKNGQQLKTDGLIIDPTDLYPCVTLMNPGDMIQANFDTKLQVQIGTDGNNS